MPSTTATYLYCLVRAARKPAVARIPPGIPGGTTPEAVAIARSLWMIAGDVPLDVYGPGPLEERLQDLDWVSEVAVAHEGVVEHFAHTRGSTVVPMKLFTMFSTRDKAVRDVMRRRALLARVFERIRGCEEWGVRVTQAREAPVEPVRRGRRSPAPATGAAFLTARKEARDGSRRARETAAEAAEAALARLERLARDAHLRDRRAAPGTNPPLLEAAFLVPVRSRARFTAEARRQAAACARAHADMTLTGPWPAYNFVDGRGQAR